MNIQTLRHNRLYCSLDERPEGLFFSLVDYRNNYFTSNHPKKIIEFYDGFENRDQLIQWMRERPKGGHTIYEVEGDKDIIVVIPTADYNGKFAKECRENIFKGLHIVFVESGGKGDFYFNIAHNFNVGIAKAMEYNAKWVVLSGDDMYEIDEAGKLMKELYALDPQDTDIVLACYSNYHSIPMYIANLTKLSFLVYGAYYGSLKPYKLMKKFGVQTVYLRADERAVIRLASSISFRRIRFTEFVNVIDFGIVSTNFVRKVQNIFSEEFINEGEETDFSFRAKLGQARIRSIDYKIGDYVGSNLGTGYDRSLRSFLGRLLFDEKFMTDYSKKIMNLHKSKNPPLH